MDSEFDNTDRRVAPGPRRPFTLSRSGMVPGPHLRVLRDRWPIIALQLDTGAADRHRRRRCSRAASRSSSIGADRGAECLILIWPAHGSGNAQCPQSRPAAARPGSAWLLMVVFYVLATYVDLFFGVGRRDIHHVHWCGASGAMWRGRSGRRTGNADHGHLLCCSTSCFKIRFPRGDPDGISITDRPTVTEAIVAMASVMTDPYLLFLILMTTIIGVIIGALAGPRRDDRRGTAAAVHA